MIIDDKILIRLQTLCKKALDESSSEHERSTSARILASELKKVGFFECKSMSFDSVSDSIPVYSPREDPEKGDRVGPWTDYNDALCQCAHRLRTHSTKSGSCTWGGCGCRRFRDRRTGSPDFIDRIENELKRRRVKTPQRHYQRHPDVVLIEGEPKERTFVPSEDPRNQSPFSTQTKSKFWK